MGSETDGASAVRALLREWSGDEGALDRGALPNGIHVIVDEVNLAAAGQFQLQRGFDQGIVEWRHHGLNRQTAIWGVSITDISRSPSIDMCSVRGIGVALMVSTSTLFMLHAEALLFVDNHQAQVLEFHVLGEQTVRADGDVHFAFGHIYQPSFQLLR
jgi:hypothetical protein